MQQQPFPSGQSTMSLTMGGHNPTFHVCWRTLHCLLHHLHAVPGPCTANRNGPVAVIEWRSGLLHYLLPEHIGHLTITRRRKIQNKIWKKLNVAKRNRLCLKNEFNIPKLIPLPPNYWFTHKWPIIFTVSVSVCLFVCAEFFSAVFDLIWIKLGHMLHVRV